MGKIIDYINENLDLRDEYYRIFNRHLPNGKFICPNPEHQHTSNTPSCKAYGNGFKCFGQCNRFFGVYDLLKWYDPSRINEVKSTIVVPQSSHKSSAELLSKVSVDRNKSLTDILTDITGICLHLYD